MTCRLQKIFTLTALLGAGAAAAGDSKLAHYEEGWWQRVAASIAESEYDIVADSVTGYGQDSLVAVNRAQNLRAEFSASGVTITPRVGQSEGWSLGISLLGVERYQALEPAAVKGTVAGERAVTYIHGDIVETYTNEKGGILLNVVLSRSASLDENSQLAFRIDTALAGVVGIDASQVDFYFGGVRVARISLKTSATGGVPTARLDGGRLLILAPDSAGVTNDVLMSLTTVAGEDTQVGPSAAADSILDEEQPDSNFALSVAPAGDVNADGYSDVIVGAPDYDVGQLAAAGRVLVYAGSRNGLATSPIWTRDGEDAGGRFGSSVAPAGDFDADGISDVVIGAEASDLAIVFAGSATADLVEVARFSGAADSAFGFSVDAAGDVNDDGADDIVVGAPEFGGNGRSYVYFSPFGSAATAGGSYCLDVPVLGDWCTAFPPAGNPCPGSQFGFSVSGAGDVDGDGNDDLIVGAPSYGYGSLASCATPAGGGGGEAFVYLGSVLAQGQAAGQCSTVANWCSEASHSSGDRVGFSVDTAGDVDADGYDDVVVGAPSLAHLPVPRFACGQSVDDAGAALVFRATAGRAPPGDFYILEKGILEGPYWQAIGFDGSAVSQGTDFGSFVASAGDVNGDGAGDIIVGAPAQSNAAPAGGGAYIFTGEVETGLPSTEQVRYRIIVACNSGSADGIALPFDAAWSATGTQRSGNLGRVVSAAGDVNGDGFTDFLDSAVGQVSAYHGAGLLPDGELRFLEFDQIGLDAFVGDMNGDGFDDVARHGAGGIEVFRGTDGEPLTAGSWVLAAASGDEVVSAAGDVNGDGFADLIVGRPSTSRVEIYAGGDPPTPATVWVISATAGMFGSAVASAGDVNGDGYADVIVGDPSANGDTGMAWVFLGAASGLAAGPDIDASSANWSSGGAGPGARFGYSVATAGDINADGFSDVVVGAPGDGIDDTGEAFLFLGSLLTPLKAQSWSGRGKGQAGAEFGASVASAGDVNGDGFGDVVVGAPGTDSSNKVDVGRAFAYLGSAAGLDVVEIWSFEGLDAGARLGKAVGNAGDVNGDGLIDVLIRDQDMRDIDFDGTPELVTDTHLFLGAVHGISSSPSWPDADVSLDSETDTGNMTGGSGDYNGDGFSDFLVGGIGPVLANYRMSQFSLRWGVPRLPRQIQAGSDVNIAPQGILDANTGTSFRIRVSRPAAPGRYGLDWEIKPLGAPFDGSGLQRGGLVDFLPGDPQMDLTETIDQLEPGTPYRWRARIVSDSVTVPYSPWLRVSGGTQGADLLTAGGRAPFPFASAGPAQNMQVFADSLPPVFQWHAGGNSSFELEWAGNAEFSDPRISSGNLGATGNDIETYTPDSAAWLDILRTARNPDFREAPVFWQIIAGGSTASETRALRLAAAEPPIVASPADGQASFAPPLFAWNPNHNEGFQVRFSANNFLGEPLIIVADDDDIADGPGDFDITANGITIPDAIWLQVEALVPPGADGTGLVYFAVRGRDALGRTTISDVRSLRVNATGTAPPPPPKRKKKGGGSESPAWLIWLLASAATGFRRRSDAPGRP